MKILYISNSGDVGGAPKALLNLICELSGRHEVAVVLPERDTPLEKAVTRMGVRCYIPDSPYPLTVYPMAIRPSKYLRQLHRVRECLKRMPEFIGQVMDEFRPDIVHTNVGPLDYALEECRRRGIPHVWHIREYQYGMHPFPSRKSFLSHLHSSWNHAIAITSDLSGFWGLKEDDAVIYDGVLERGRIPDRTVLEGARKTYFLYVGRIEKVKGTDIMLRGFRKFHRIHPEYSLKLAGRPCGLFAVIWRMYARLFMGSAVEFLGVRNDIRELMKEAQAMIVPSRQEAFGFATVEAMSEGCLVIGKDSCGTKEILDRAEKLSGGAAGLRFTDPDSLCERLSEVAMQDFREERARAWELSGRLYSTERYASEIEGFYGDIIKKK